MQRGRKRGTFKKTNADSVKSVHTITQGGPAADGAVRISFKTYTITAEFVSQSKSLEVSKKIDFYPALEASGLAFLVRFSNVFRCKVDIKFGGMLSGKLDRRFCLRHCPHALSYDIRKTD